LWLDGSNQVDLCRINDFQSNRLKVVIEAGFSGVLEYWLGDAWSKKKLLMEVFPA
jgi:hypothetical protein